MDFGGGWLGPIHNTGIKRRSVVRMALFHLVVYIVIALFGNIYSYILWRDYLLCNYSCSSYFGYLITAYSF